MWHDCWIFCFFKIFYSWSNLLLSIDPDVSFLTRNLILREKFLLGINLVDSSNVYAHTLKPEQFKLLNTERKQCSSPLKAGFSVMKFLVLKQQDLLWEVFVCKRTVCNPCWCVEFSDTFFLIWRTVSRALCSLCSYAIRKIGLRIVPRTAQEPNVGCHKKFGSVATNPHLLVSGTVFVLWRHNLVWHSLKRCFFHSA